MGGLWSVSCCAYLVDCSSFECFMYFRSTVNVPSPSLLFKSEIQMTCLVVCCFVFFLFCFVFFRGFVSYTGVFTTITSTLGEKNLLCENHCTYLWRNFWKSRMIQVSTRSWSAWLWSAGNKLWTFHKTELNLGSLGIWTDIGTWDCQLNTVTI